MFLVDELQGCRLPYANDPSDPIVQVFPYPIVSALRAVIIAFTGHIPG